MIPPRGGLRLTSLSNLGFLFASPPRVARWRRYEINKKKDDRERSLRVVGAAAMG
jgi:hypothetical protein